MAMAMDTWHGTGGLGDEGARDADGHRLVRLLAHAGGAGGLVVALVGAVLVPSAHAHHKDGHGPSSSAPVEKTATTMRAWGTWHVDSGSSTVRGFVLSGERGDQRLGLNRDNSGLRAAGLTVTVTATSATGTTERVVVVAADGSFTVDVSSTPQPLLFVASTQGDETRSGSQTSGYFHPSHRWPPAPVPPLPVSPPCLNWDC